MSMTPPPGGPIAGCQNIYDRHGTVVFPGGWDSRELLKAVTGPEGLGYWSGRTVLDIGANTSGLSIELARHGARVVASEPDPYKNTKHRCRQLIDQVIAEEGLQLRLESRELFDVHALGRFDTVLCLGLVYHFRDQQFVLDYLSTLDHDELIISNQTHGGEGLVMVNRMDPSVIVPRGFWDKYQDSLSGWHPTRPLFARMLAYAGYRDVVPLTDVSINYPQKPLAGVTNSSYFRARKGRSVDPVQSRKKYLPR